MYQTIQKTVQADASLAAARQLQESVVSQQKIQTVAGVSTGSVAPVYLGDLDPITVVHTAGTAAEIIRIGDFDGTIAAANNIGTITGYSNTTGSTWTATQLASFTRKGFLVGELNYQVDVATQFTSPFQYLTTDVSGAFGGRNIAGRFAASTRPGDLNLLTKTLDLRSGGKQLLINETSALFLTVAAGRTVTITITFGANVAQ